jgi:thiol-disulfide isomerase/thioredoxin
MKKILSLTTLVVMLSVVFVGCSAPNESVSLESEAVPSQVEEATESAMTLSGSYVDYSEEALAAATAEDGKAVIFFHAGWCPTCRAAEKDILENSETIPEDVTILKADFDTERELKQKYEIVTQHTFVQVDADGNEISKWVGGDLKAILQRIQR